MGAVKTQLCGAPLLLLLLHFETSNNIRGDDNISSRLY